MSKSELHSLECRCGACAPAAHNTAKSDAKRIALAVLTLALPVALAVAAFWVREGIRFETF